jgi:predicted small lipoprotein YifL
MHHTFAIALLLTGLVALGGCGQTGPLYLPGDDDKESRKPEPVGEPPQALETAA